MSYSVIVTGYYKAVAIVCRYWKTDIQGASSGPLFGKTLAIKDNIAVAGVPMMNGSRVLEGYVPEFDATVVTRVLDAGTTSSVSCHVLLGGSMCWPWGLTINCVTYPRYIPSI